MRVLAICLMILACMATVIVAQEENAAQLAARASAAPPDQQPELYLKAAALQLKNADTLFSQGKVEDATHDVHDITDFADKATDSAVNSGKKLKNAEIGIRRIEVRLMDIQHTLSFEDQAPVKAAAEHLADLRSKLLARMFTKDKKK